MNNDRNALGCAAFVVAPILLYLSARLRNLRQLYARRAFVLRQAQFEPVCPCAGPRFGSAILVVVNGVKAFRNSLGVGDVRGGKEAGGRMTSPKK